MYWETTHDTFIQAVSDSMSRNEFERIPQNLHLCDNTKLDNADKFCKLRPMTKDLNKIFFEAFIQWRKQINRRVNDTILWHTW